jgi:SAM-dependent methyltransferase
MTSAGQVTTGMRSVLSMPAVYQLWSRLLGGDRARSVIVNDYVHEPQGARVLDLGCGTGDMLEHLPAVRYVGIDISPQYIARARARFADREAEFHVGDATAVPDGLEAFDLALVTGVLHHLDDAQAVRLLSGAASALRPTGRFLAVEPTFTIGQNRFARALIARDRGQHVRTPEQYAALLESAFGWRRISVRQDLLRVPYTHCVLESGHQPSAST